MGIETYTSYRIVCDGCQEFHTDYWHSCNDGMGFYDALQEARRRGIIEIDGKWLCPSCQAKEGNND